MLALKISIQTFSLQSPLVSGAAAEAPGFRYQSIDAADRIVTDSSLDFVPIAGAESGPFSPARRESWNYIQVTTEFSDNEGKHFGESLVFDLEDIDSVTQLIKGSIHASQHSKDIASLFDFPQSTTPAESGHDLTPHTEQ